MKTQLRGAANATMAGKLEINANGQFAWLQDATGVPIAAAIADALTKGPPR